MAQRRHWLFSRSLCPGMVAPTDDELDHLFTRRNPPRARHDHRGLSDSRMCPQHGVYGQSTQYAAGQSTRLDLRILLRHG